MQFLVFVLGFICLVVAWNIWVGGPNREKDRRVLTGWWELVRYGYGRWWLLAGVILFLIALAFESSSDLTPLPGG